MNFERQFNKFYPTLRNIAQRYSRATDIPYDEYESSLCEEFFLKYEAFNANKNPSFEGYMRVRLTQRASRVAERKERQFYDNAYFYEGQAIDEEDQELEFEIASEFNLEKYVLEKMEQKKDEDKRQLINALTKDSDSVTKKIVSEYLRSENAKPTAIGKALNIHHQTVIRKLKSIARNFNETEFGELNAYLVS